MRRIALLVVLAATGAGLATAWASAPSNDDFAGAISVTLPYASGPIDTTQATVGPDDSAVAVACGVAPTPSAVTNPNATNSVWYAFTPAADGVVRLNASTSDYSLYAPVVTGSPATGFTRVSCATGPGGEFRVHAGTTYFIDFVAIGSPGGGTLRFTIGMAQPGDADGDGVPDASDRCPMVAAPTVDGCPAPPQNPVCARRNLHLVDVLAAGRAKVRVRGIADTRYVGRMVRILRDHAAAGTTVVRRNGRFSALVAAPPPGRRATSRYRADIGAARTESLKLQRRMVAARLTRRGNRLTFAGRIKPPFAGAPARVFLQRYLSCGGKQSVRIKGVRPRSDGRFLISLRVPPASAGVLMYRATTKVAVRAGGRADRRTFTLPRPIDTR